MSWPIAPEPMDLSKTIKGVSRRRIEPLHGVSIISKKKSNVELEKEKEGNHTGNNIFRELRDTSEETYEEIQTKLGKTIPRMQRQRTELSRTIRGEEDNPYRRKNASDRYKEQTSR